MSGESTCRRCGYAGPSDARYCARCGRALVPLRARLAAGAGKLQRRLTSLHAGLLGLATWTGLGLLAHHLLVSEGLYFPASFVVLALGIGLGGAALGWLWAGSSPGRRLAVVLLVAAGVALFLLAVWQLDRALLSAADSGRTIVSTIPGVRLEAEGGYKRHHAVSDPPPYWLIALGYAALAAVAGHLARRRSR